MQSASDTETITLQGRGGLICRLIPFGATLTELLVPDRTGTAADVLLGYGSPAAYRGDTVYFGATIGRVANRIGGSKFTLDGRTYTLAANDGPNHLHGGPRGFNQVAWQAEVQESPGGPSAVLVYHSADGDEGYPGALRAQVRFTVTADNAVRIEYEAQADKPTPVNLTNHAYFNLAGGGSVLEHELELNADAYTPMDGGGIPTGDIAPVAGTPLDFRQAKTLGRDLGQLTNRPQGYDHNFVLRGENGQLRWAARAWDPSSGRGLEVLTTQPGIQMYTGNHLNGSVRGKQGAAYPQHSALCLETQHFPDSVNQPSFPSTILRPGNTYRSTTLYRFFAR